MRLRALFAAFIVLCPQWAFAATLYNTAPSAIYETNGALARSAKAYFYAAGTTTPIVVYQDSALSTPHAFPVRAGINGVLPPIFLPYVDYHVRITTQSGAIIFDADNISNPAPPSAGGGAGISVAQNQIFNTGFIVSRLTGGLLDGFVRMNGRTIGSAASAATERANDDTEALFLYLWTNVSDTYAAVAGGRGASAAADWAANKTIIVPSMQGRLLAGVDDMGAPAANILQTSTTATATNGSPTITVASATGISRGMKVLLDNTSAGTVTNISGTTITLSANYAGATGAGKAARFSQISDAQAAAGVGGDPSILMTTLELAAHTHSVTDPGHAHTLPGYWNGAVGTAGAIKGALTNDVGGYATSVVTTGVSVQSTGQGAPLSLVQPTRMATFYIKL